MVVRKMKRTRARNVPAPVPSVPLPKPPVTSPLSVAWKPHLWRILAVWAFTLLAYSNSFRDGLTLDNVAAIVKDSRVHAFTSQNLHLILSEELWYNSSTTGLYRPLTTFSYLLNYTVLGNGEHLAGYHLVNLTLHAANIGLVYLLGLLILEETALAWALAALWGLHPLLTESVTNIVGRADLLAAFGILAGLLCHVQGARAAGRRKAWWVAGVAVAATIGLFSKESAAVLPAVLLAYDLAWLRAARWRDRWPGYAALVPPFALFFSLRAEMLSRHFVGLVPFVDNPLMGADFWTARLTALKVIGKYLWLFFWPSRLSADYSYNAVPLFGWQWMRWADAQAVVALAVCLAAVALAIYSYRRSKPVCFFVALFVVALAPVANLVMLIGTIMAERFLYLPSIGLVGCVVVALHAASRRLSARWSGAPRAAGVLVVLLCVACAARAYVRNFDWFDELSLGRSAVRACPDSFKAHFLLASSLLDAGPSHLDQAIGELDRTLAIVASLSDEQGAARPYELTAIGYRMKGDSLMPGAAGDPAKPDSPSANWYRKALALLERGETIDRAETQRTRALNLEYGKRVDPIGRIPLYLELGRIYIRLDEPEKALEALARGRARRADAEFSEEMAHARRVMGDPGEAAVALLEGLVLDPASVKLASDLVQLYRQTAPGSCAIRSGDAPSINLDCPLVRGQLCSASRNIALSYRQSGQTAKAGTTTRTALAELGCPADSFR